MDLKLSEKNSRYFWFLAAACVVSLFLCLGESLFNTRGEPREAVVALTMLTDGDWILPINNGVDMPYKPPFMHWGIALISTLTGGINEFTSRFPSALALSLMVLSGYKFYARRRGAGIALLASFLTLTNFEVHRAGMACRVDMVLTFMMVGALYLLFIWVEKGFKGIPWLGILCLSGAFLSKGPVGAALPCLTVAVYAWIRQHGFWRVLGKMFLAGLLSCILPFAWYIAAYQQGGAPFLTLVYEENVLRLLGKMTYASHINPAWYNFQTVITGFLPYSLLVLMSLFVLRNRKPTGTVAAWWSRVKDYVRHMDDTRLFSLVSIIVIFGFYCIPASKRSVYLLPVYPFLAYFLAEFIVWLRDHHTRLLRSYGWIIGSLVLLTSVFFVAIRAGLIPESLFGGSAHSGSDQDLFASLHDTPLTPLGILGFIAALTALGFFIRTRRQATRLIPGILAMVFSLFFVLDALYLPMILNAKSDKPVAEQIARIAPEGKVYSYRSDVCEGNRMHPFTINFYLNNRVIPFDVFLPEAGYVIVGNDDIEVFRQTYPDYEVEQVVDFNHKSCDDRHMTKLYRFDKR